MQIRKMLLADVDRISELEEMIFTMPWHKESFIEMIENPDSVYMVAIEDEKPVALCGIIDIAGEGNISNVLTDPEYRGRGFGYEVVKAAMEECLKGKTECFTLEVRVSNTPAISLYEKLGFVSEGVRPNYYEKPTEDALIMWKR